MKPTEYVKNFLKTNQLSELIKIAESQVKTLNERRVSQNTMDFVTNDLPCFISLIQTSKESLSREKIKNLENRIGENEKNQRKFFDFWSKVLNEAKRMNK